MKYALSALLFVVLAACGGGGGGGGGGGAPAGVSPADINFSGVAVDGYLYRARAFLDINGNGQYDSGEPTATTDSNGGFTLSATQDQINSHSVVVSAIAGITIDQDYPNTPLSSGMTLVAPAGNPSVVSPLTTLVSAKMAGGLSLADAKSAVQTELGLPNIDVMKNFVAEKATNPAYAEVHKVAIAAAVVLKSIEAQSSSSTTLIAKLSAAQAKVVEVVIPNISAIKQSLIITNSASSSPSSSSPSSSSSSSPSSPAEVVANAIAREVNIYSIGGTISGLNSSGLILANGANTLSPSSGANSFTFSSRKAAGAAYAITVQANPTGQVCTVSNGAGTIGSQSITNVSISCSNTPGALGGTITGLNTSGLVLKNGSNELTVASGSSSFLFNSTVADGSAFSVAVKTQPTGKTCSVSNGSGTMVSAGINSVQVTCSSNSYSISGSISGLVTSGLKLKNGSEVLTVSSGANTFTLKNAVAFGGTYSVSIDTQPIGHTCSLNNSSGVMGAVNLTSVQVSCAANSYTLSGSISGLTSTGLKLKNGSEVININPGSTGFVFTSRLAYGGAYAVTIETQPIGVSCSLSNSSGTVGAGNITSAQVTCTPNFYTVNANVSGLMAGQTLTLYYNNNIRGGMASGAVVNANGIVALANGVPHNTYASIALTRAPGNGQNCYATFNYSDKSYGQYDQVSQYITEDTVAAIVCTPFGYTATISGLTLSTSQRLYYYNRGFGNIYVTFGAGQLGQRWQVTYTYSQAGDVFNPTYNVNGVQQRMVNGVRTPLITDAKFEPNDPYTISVTTDSEKTCAASIPSTGTITSNLSFSINCN